MRIPQEVLEIIEKLKEKGFQAFIVGGCVRDIFLGKEPEDWDVATNAKPAQIQEIFPKSFYENKYFTVTVLTDSKNPKLREIEVTTFRIESAYKDRRHPEKVEFAKTIEEDLSRRDFTINAIALDVSFNNRTYQIIDPFGGQKDLEEKKIRAVGNPDERFSEDALRMMRAVRLKTVLDSFLPGWEIEEKTKESIKKNAHLLKEISKERIRDELVKILMTKEAAAGIDLLRELGLLSFIIPELLEGYGVSQNKHHIYDVYTHNLKTLDYAAKKGFSQSVRLAALLHDIAKPRVKQGEGPDATFYNHEIVGAQMAYEILKRLRFPRKEMEKVSKLVRYHLFYYNVGEVTEASVRRLLRKVGKENIEELIQLRMADRIGSGCPKAEPYKLRHLRYVIEKISRDPISVKMLKVNGHDVINLLNLSPGEKVGKILHILLDEVLQDPQKNKEDYLKQRIKEIGSLTDEEINKLYLEAKKRIEEIEQKRDEMTKKKYWVV